MYLLPAREDPCRAHGSDDPMDRCVEACLDAAQACLDCAETCAPTSAAPEARPLLRFARDAADLCEVTTALAARRGGTNDAVVAATLEACALANRRCAEACERLASGPGACRVCADACRACERACVAALVALGRH